MKVQEWRPVGKITPQALGSARLQAHNAAQWVARLAHSYLPHQADDRHLDLIWDERDSALISRDIGDGLAVGLDVANLALEFREQGLRSPHRLDLEGRSPAEVEAWCLIELLHRHRDRDRFSKALPFEIAGLMSGDNVDFAQGAHAAELAELAHWQANAAVLLKQAAGGAAPVICSPNHFDLAVVMPVEGRPTAAVRAGFAPGDERLPEPYFYVAKGAALQSAVRADIPRIGRVELRDLVAQILPASEVAASAAGAELALQFLRTGIAECQRQQAQ
jgi:hypothetical protein